MRRINPFKSRPPHTIYRPQLFIGSLRPRCKCGRCCARFAESNLYRTRDSFACAIPAWRIPGRAQSRVRRRNSSRSRCAYSPLAYCMRYGRRSSLPPASRSSRAGIMQRALSKNATGSIGPRAHLRNYLVGTRHCTRR